MVLRQSTKMFKNTQLIVEVKNDFHTEKYVKIMFSGLWTMNGLIEFVMLPYCVHQFSFVFFSPSESNL